MLIYSLKRGVSTGAKRSLASTGFLYELETLAQIDLSSISKPLLSTLAVLLL